MLTGSSTSSQGQREQNGYTFVYHPDASVTVVKQSYSTHGKNLTLVGPSGSVGWLNASGGSSRMLAQFEYRRVGAGPGDTLQLEHRVDGNLTVLAANSTVPDRVSSNRQFVVAYHQAPFVTVVVVTPNETNTSNLELVGPHGSVRWADAQVGSSKVAATFAYTATYQYHEGHIDAAAGDTLKLVRVDPKTGNRTVLRRTTIP